MFFKQWKSNEKHDKLCDLSDDVLLDRIRSFPNQDMLNMDMNGRSRKLQVGLVAEQYELKSLDDNMRKKLRQAFSSITTMAAEIQGTPDMPDNVFGRDLWNFYQGGTDGIKINFGLTEEAPGKIAVSVPTTDLSTVKIGYLDERFADTYPIHGSCIAEGQYHKNKIEILFDAEKLYAESKLEPALTDGKHIYEMPFNIGNIQFETSQWDDRARGEIHKPNPQILKMFEDNMNAFPIKDMVGDLFAKNGLENPITDITWHIDGEFKLQITSDESLSGSQLLCAERTLCYLTRESAFKKNEDNHVFGKYMDTDVEFLKAVQNTFETRMYPSCDSLLHLEDHLTEVKKEPDITLTNDDLVGLDQIDGMSV